MLARKLFSAGRHAQASKADFPSYIMSAKEVFRNQVVIKKNESIHHVGLMCLGWIIKNYAIKKRALSPYLTELIK